MNEFALDKLTVYINSKSPPTHERLLLHEAKLLGVCQTNDIAAAESLCFICD